MRKRKKRIKKKDKITTGAVQRCGVANVTGLRIAIMILEISTYLKSV